MPRLADVLAVLEELYDPALAEEWDAVGLVCGDPDADVRRVLFAVDPVEAVGEEAVGKGVDLLVAHHPLFLRPVHGVAASTPKGRLVHRLLRHDIALYVAHTNADAASPGVSDALAAALDLRCLRPLEPRRDQCGLGRVCELDPPEPLAAFVERVGRVLPGAPGGLRVAGDPEATVRTVAVCGGAGDGLLDRARAEAVDVFLTADLRHHPASEAREHGPPALVDAPHWATEWPWTAAAARQLADAMGARGATVDTDVSHVVTDPWTASAPIPGSLR